MAAGTPLRRTFALALGTFLASGSPHSAWARRLPSADFLNLTMHPEPLAMGEAGVASVQGPGLTFLNPAAAATMDARVFSFTHGVLPEGTSVGQYAFGAFIGRHGFAASYAQMAHGSLAQRDASGLQTGGFSPKDSAVSLTYAARWGRLAAGVTAKDVRSQIVKKASAFSADAGLQFALKDDLDLGLAALNTFGSLKFDRTSDPLPRTIRAGAQWKPVPAVRAVLDAVKPFYGDAYTALGGAYERRAAGDLSVVFRAGVNTKTPDLGGFSGVNAGLGFRFKKLTVDYALDPYGDIGLTHRFGVDYAW